MSHWDKLTTAIYQLALLPRGINRNLPLCQNLDFRDYFQ